MNKSSRDKGQLLNKEWNIHAKHALYSEYGKWYHVLERFPGALIDKNGYVIFDSREKYESCKYLNIGKELNIGKGISAIPGYVRVKDDFKSELKEEAPEYRKNIELELADLEFQSLNATPDLHEPNKRFTQAKIKARDAGFRIAIRKLYRDTCAVCGNNLYAPDGKAEVESAHIYPRKYNGSNDYRNGIAVCRFHHWAFDCGWFSISDDLAILVRDDLPKANDYKRIAQWANKKLSPPSNPLLTPHPIYLAAHRKLHGF